MKVKLKKRSDAGLVFVYNAGSGLFNAVTDLAHKALSPRTYRCQLCALTYSTFRMRESWKQFLRTLDEPLEFLHADELESLYGVSGVPLPAVFRREGTRLELLIESEAINACRDLEELKRLCEERLR